MLVTSSSNNYYFRNTKLQCIYVRFEVIEKLKIMSFGVASSGTTFIQNLIKIGQVEKGETGRYAERQIYRYRPTYTQTPWWSLKLKSSKLESRLKPCRGKHLYEYMKCAMKERRTLHVFRYRCTVRTDATSSKLHQVESSGAGGRCFTGIYQTLSIYPCCSHLKHWASVKRRYLHTNA
jgi:hypothetical protein